MNRLQRRAASAAAVLLAACAQEVPRYREGPAESDTRYPPSDTAEPDDPDAPVDDTGDPGDDDPDDDIPDPEPTDSEVCYPGPDGDYSVCLPLVAWDSAWGDDYAYPEPLDGSAQYLAPAYFVDLASPGADPSLAIAENFVLDEVMQEWKGRLGLFQVHVVEKMQLVRDAIGGPLTVNSGYRNVTYNAGVGGATWSRHQYGDAIDIASSAASLESLGALCEDLGAGYIGWYTSHVHCDWRDDPLDEGFFPAEADAACGHAGLTGTVDGRPLREWVRTAP